MSGVFFYTLLLSFTSGIFLCSFFVLDFIMVAWILLVGSCLFLWALRKRIFVPGAGVFLCSISLIGIALGIGRYNVSVALTPIPLLITEVGTVHTYTGQIVQEPEAATNGTNVVIQIGEERVLVKIDRQAVVSYGDTVSVTGKLALPGSFITDLGREFDYPGYLRAKGIAYTMSFAQITVIDHTTGNTVLRFLFATKARFIEVLKEMLPEPHVGLGEGLLLGVNHVLGSELETIFRRAGIIHIVVLSGYNIFLVVQFVLLVLGRFLPLRIRAIVGMLAIVGFALVVGLGASVVRASIMAALGLVAVLFGRTYAVTRALFLAGAGMLMVNPYLLVHDIGFQLSFMATLGLLLVSPRVKWLVTLVPMHFGLQEFLLATIATQIAVLPLLLYTMGQFSIISLVANVLVLPIVAVAMLLTFLTGIVALFSTGLALPLSYGAYVVLAYIINVATKCAALPFAVVGIPFFPWYAVFISYALMGLWLYVRTPTSLPVSTTDFSAVSSWTIVEETDDVPNKKTERAGDARPVSVDSAVVTKSDTPIFFR